MTIYRQSLFQFIVTSSPSSAFIFSEPTPENVSSNSNFADLTIDGNVTIFFRIIKNRRQN